MSRHDWPAILAFAILALLLLAGTVAWMIPMMLWDHLDLLPMIDALAYGGLLDSGFWSMHGGHVHTTAYGVLLATTTLGDGRPWVDGVVSWALLVATATVVLVVALRTVPGGSARAAWLSLIALLALYPGHLANLQWGWQVAVFLCLPGVAIALFLLSAATLDWRRNVAALVAAVLALTSFATALAVVPTALILLALRRDPSPGRRTLMALPWLLLGTIAVWPHLHPAAPALGARVPSLADVAIYALNFLGSGVSRFATDLAPLLALVSLSTGTWLVLSRPTGSATAPWRALWLFGIVAALAVALGRSAPFGSDHAFVTRYVSFSSFYWLGWVGLMATSSRPATTWSGRWATAFASLVAFFALANAVHLGNKAARLSHRTHAIAHEIRVTWPDVRDELLRDIYFDQPDIARMRLSVLARYGWPPFPHRDPGE